MRVCIVVVMLAASFVYAFEGSAEGPLIERVLETSSYATTTNTDTVPVWSMDDYEFQEEAGETYEYESNAVQLFQYIQGKIVYLDASNHQVGQYIVSTEQEHNFLTFYQYSLKRKDAWEEDNQIVLRHLQSLYYLCITNCGIFYVSPTFTTDCVFVKEVVQEISTEMDSVYLIKYIKNIAFYVNMKYGQINFKNKATMYMRNVSTLSSVPLTTMVDKANTDPCVAIVKKSGNKEEEKQSEALDEFKNIVTSKATTLTVMVVCLTVSVVIVGLLIIVVSIFKHKRKVLRMNN